MKNLTSVAAVDAILLQAPVLPVLSIADLNQAIPLAQALVEAGLPVLEITLRTSVALAAITAIRKAVPKAIVGVGTVLSTTDLQAATDAGAQFAISPGTTPMLYQAAATSAIPYLPAIATASELMHGLEQGYQRFKFFPATAAGGIPALKAFGGPFAQAKFCPTGGIDQASAPSFLALANVLTVGGSWMVPNDALQAGNYQRISELAAIAAQLKTKP
jgi:2-dehydro-3-deoxyphosphogluconate aldolase / (4S)-4-hydroxy-2-oxoglutarate aldolase